MSQIPTRNPKQRSSIQNTSILAKRSRRRVEPFSKRDAHEKQPGDRSYVPPEDWYEPTENDDSTYQIISQRPGDGYQHVVTPDEIRQRLSLLPGEMLSQLDVVQLSRMTHKKKRFPCYGMQWGTTVYLYPVESSLVEYLSRPPKPTLQTEVRMYGGRWCVEADGTWKLVWSTQSIKDFYLNNVLIHELGHLLDNRNASYVDRERYAEWFAVEFGYKCKHRKEQLENRQKKSIRRRHHSKS